MYKLCPVCVCVCVIFFLSGSVKGQRNETFFLTLQKDLTKNTCERESMHQKISILFLKTKKKKRKHTLFL